MIKPNEKIYVAYFVKRYEINASYFQDPKLSEKGVDRAYIQKKYRI